MDPKFKRTLTMIGVVVGLLLVMMQEFWLILLIASMFFFGYVVSKAEPQKIKYEVSNHGFMVDDKTYYWYEFVRGFFSEKYGKEILILDTKTHLPPRLFVTFLHQDKTKLTGILKERINFLDKEPESIIDKYAAKVADKFDFKIKKS